MRKKEVKRESGIELLKIFALILIVISHVVGALGSRESDRSVMYYLEYGAPTSDLSVLIISFLSQLENIGSNIFFICSAWFFVGQKEFRSKKAVVLWSDTLFISLIWFITTSLLKINVGKELTLKSLLPNLYNNNWYITLYIIFLFIYPVLNRAMEALTQRQHLSASILLFIFGLFTYFYFPSAPFSSSLTVWVSLYFIISYLKIYGMKVCDSILTNLFLFVIGILGIVWLMILQNYFGIKEFENNPEHLFRWNSLANPFVILFCFGLFNIMRQIRFKSRFINYISSLSLFVYLIHDNILFKSYFGPRIWSEIAVRFELYDDYVKWIFIYSGALILVSVIVSIIYKAVIKQLLTYPVEKAYDFFKWLIGKGINLIAK